MIKKISLISALLVIYVTIIVGLGSDNLQGDEFRYISYAKNLSHGYFTNSENPDLSNGPGYPLVLLPFISTNVNLILPRLLNAIFVLFGVVYFFKTLQFYVRPKLALIFAGLLGLYPPLLKMMPTLYTESLSFLLVNGAIFYFCSLYKNDKKLKNWLLASLFLGFLTLTKVIFFNVLVMSMLISLVLLFLRKQLQVKLAIMVLLGGVLFTAPYLYYAYSVTGKLFYLGTRGGELLYHRSTPNEGEFGNWFSPDRVLAKNNSEGKEQYERLTKLRSNHSDFYYRLQPLSNIQRDSAFKAKAIENMKTYPLKYVKNTVASTGRFFFNTPNSYRYQELGIYGYIAPNGFILVLLVLIAWPAFLARKSIPFEIKALLLFATIYGFGIVLLLGKPRYFIMMVPYLALFLAYCYTQLVKISFVKGKQSD